VYARKSKGKQTAVNYRNRSQLRSRNFVRTNRLKFLIIYLWKCQVVPNNWKVILHLLQPTKCTISYTYNSTDITPTCFGMNMTSSGSAWSEMHGVNNLINLKSKVARVPMHQVIKVRLRRGSKMRCLDSDEWSASRSDSYPTVLFR
jgi:hypothetical protein